MEALQRNTDTARVRPGAASDTQGAASRRSASAAETRAPADGDSTVTLSRRAQELLASRKAQESDAAAVQQDQAQVQQMALLNAQLRRAYQGDGGAGGAG